MHVHDEVRIALRIGCRVRLNAAHRAADMGDENLALRRGQGADCAEQLVYGLVRQVPEVVALPVVARARLQERIERGLPAGEGMGADHIGDGVPQGAELGHGFLALGHVAAIAGGEDQHLLAVPLFRQEGQGRGLAQNGPDGQLVGRIIGNLAEGAKQVLGVVQRVNDQAGKNLGPHIVKLELEAGDDAEIPAPAADRPEEVAVLGLASAQDFAAGGHHLGPDQVVYGHAMLAGDPAEAAAQRQARDAGGRIDADRGRQGVRLGFLV